MNQIERQVLTLIGEDPDAPDVFIDNEDDILPIRDSINDAVEEMAMVTGFNTREITIPLKSGTNFYKIDPTVGRYCYIDYIWIYSYQRRLEQVGFTNLLQYNSRWLQNTGQPELYVLVGYDKICVHPAPSSSADSLDVRFVVIPNRYTTGTDMVQIRNEYRFALANYAVGEYYASRGAAKEAQYHHMKYIEGAKLFTNLEWLPGRQRYYQTVKNEQPIQPSA